MAGQDWQLGSFIYFSSRDKGFEKGQFVWKGGIRVESVSYPRTADRGHPSLHVFASRLHLGSQLCLRVREGGGSCLLSLPRPLWRNLEAPASERTLSLAPPSSPARTGGGLYCFFRGLKSWSDPGTIHRTGVPVISVYFRTPPPKTNSKIPSLQANSSP